MNAPRFQIIKPGNLPDYRDLAGDIGVASWPEFMMHDSIANEYWHELFDRFSEYQFALLDTETKRMAAMGNSLPFHWDEDISVLPEGGWDWVFLKAVEDLRMVFNQISNPQYKSPSIPIIKARD